MTSSAVSEGNFTQWHTGSPSYTKVNAVTTNDGDATYIADSRNNDRQTFVFPNNLLLPGVTTINSVTLDVQAKAAVTNPTKFSLSVAKGSTSDDSPYGGVHLTTSYLDYTRVMTTNPFTGQPWTVQDINSMTTGGSQLSFGATQNTNAKEVRITKVSLMIDYVDNTPPVIAYAINGKLGNNGWYVGDVQVNWTVTDPESPITSSTGCTTTNITTDTTGTILTCTATSGGGTSSTSVTIKRDATPPVLTVPSPITKEATGPSGAVVTFSTSATDNFATTSEISIICTTQSGSIFPYTPNPSKSTLTTDSCTATDEAGNTDTKTFGVTITDTTPPTLTVLGSNPLKMQTSTTYSDAGATASDIVDGDLTSKIATINNVDPSNPGVYTVTYDVSDLSTNAAPTLTRTVDVIEVQFDQEKYSYADTAIVSVTDKLSDGRPNPVTVLVESIKPDGTTRGNVTVQLTPTGVDGTFDNSDNQIYFVSSVDSSTQEQLVAQEGDNLRVTYFGFTGLAQISPSGVSPLAFPGAYPSSTDPVRFYESDEYYPSQSATIKVNDASAPTSVKVHVSSTSDPVGFDVSLQSDAGSTTSFTTLSSLSFDPVSSVPSSNIIKASVHDVVTATYGANTARASIVYDPSSRIANMASYSPDTTIRSTCAGDADTDEDGICDSWEDTSLHPGSLVIPSSLTGTQYTLSCNPSATYATDPTGATVCPSKTQKDVYVEMDYMAGHKPSIYAISDVVQAFLHSPVRGTPRGAINGIALHVFVDEAIPHIAKLQYSSTNSSDVTVLSLKKQFFGTAAERASVADPTQLLAAKRQIFHWGLFIHDQADNPQSSGLGEKPGNDFIVSMGEFAGHVGSTQQQESTIMHELGHNLGLDHGGVDSINCKGNYPSVMNYLFQFDKSNGGLLQSRPLDFSRVKYPAISESALSETTTTLSGSGGSASSTMIGGITAGGIPIAPFVVPIGGTGVTVDWNQDKVVTSTTYPENTHYFANVPGCDDKSVTTLSSQNDWASLVYNFRPSSTFDSGVITINQTHDDASTVGIPDPETVKPDVNAGSNVTINEGSTYSPDITIADVDSSSWTVDINYGDGSTKSVTVSDTANLSGIDHVYLDNGEYQVTVKVTNNRGGVNSDNLLVHVNNVAPTITSLTSSPASPVVYGQQVVFNAQYSDPGTLDSQKVHWIWGDGQVSDDQVPAGGNSLNATHVYAVVGDITVTLQITDKDGGVTTKTLPIHVNYESVSFKSPIDNSVYKTGRTLPIKVSVLDYNKALVPNAVVTGYWDTNVYPFTLTYDSKSNFYSYNFDTSVLSSGTHTLTVTPNDGTKTSIVITLK